MRLRLRVVRLSSRVLRLRSSAPICLLTVGWLIAISRATAEKLPVSAEMAVRLGKWCGNDGHLWIALQRDYDLWQAERKLAGQISGIPTRDAA